VFADTHHQHAPVLATDPRPSRPGPNPNSDPHKVSVTLASAELSLMAAGRAGPQNHRGAGSKDITEELVHVFTRRLRILITVSLCTRGHPAWAAL
jgi:hypothetical protein